MQVNLVLKRHISTSAAVGEMDLKLVEGELKRVIHNSLCYDAWHS